MPGGKVPVRGGVASGRLCRKVGLKTLRPYLRAATPPLNCINARVAHKQIRNAVNRYRVFHGGGSVVGRSKLADEVAIRRTRTKQIGRGPQTQTAIRQAVYKVKKCAIAAIKSNYDEATRDHLYEALSVKPNLLGDLRRTMLKRNIDILDIKRRSGDEPISVTVVNEITLLAKQDMEEAVPKRGHSDPPLATLVADLIPVWRRFTGTSPYPKNNGLGGKCSPFADWLAELISFADMRPPPANTIGRLVRLQNKKK